MDSVNLGGFTLLISSERLVVSWWCFSLWSWFYECSLMVTLECLLNTRGHLPRLGLFLILSYFRWSFHLPFQIWDSILSVTHHPKKLVLRVRWRGITRLILIISWSVGLLAKLISFQAVNLAIFKGINFIYFEQFETNLQDLEKGLQNLVLSVSFVQSHPPISIYGLIFLNKF